MTNEQLIRIFGAYMGCEAIGYDERNAEFGETKGMLIGIKKNEIQIESPTFIFECMPFECKLKEINKWH